ncbi:hypothetical protein ACFL0N_01105 [Pseudomonadota bacterium]
MAKSFLSAVIQASKAAAREAERNQKAAIREHNASIRRAEQARKAAERAASQASKAKEADRKKLEKEAKAAHFASMQAKVEEKNSGLASIYEDIENLLAATLSVDDYIDLNSLRREATDEYFDRKDLLERLPTPAEIPSPTEPELVIPGPPKALFGRKKKHAQAIDMAKVAFTEAHTAWQKKISQVQAQRKSYAEQYAQAERNRMAELEKEKNRFAAEVNEHNKKLDELIANLGYGTAEAVQEYISIVVSNSVYPKHFPVEHEFKFEPATAELIMTVQIPPPCDFPNVKAYKYIKSSDKITETLLTQRDQKSRYAGAIHQVGIRSIHEVFEADRRGIIKTISLEVGTKTIVPATGNFSYLPFLAVATSKDAFMDFDLSSIDPLATLKHLGAAISKDPYGLVTIDAAGIRRS